MTNTTNTPESLPEAPAPGPKEPTPQGSAKSHKRGLIWGLFLLIIVSVAGYAVWRAGHPVAATKGAAGAGGQKRERRRRGAAARRDPCLWS